MVLSSGNTLWPRLTRRQQRNTLQRSGRELRTAMIRRGMARHLVKFDITFSMSSLGQTSTMYLEQRNVRGLEFEQRNVRGLEF